MAEEQLRRREPRAHEKNKELLRGSSFSGFRGRVFCSAFVMISGECLLMLAVIVLARFKISPQQTLD
jgi:hypothetical protein